MKSYTDIEQSKKLAKILSLESADMKILPFTEREYRIVPINDIAVCGRDDEIYAWSLAALLGVIPKKINFGYENDSTFVLKPLENGKYLADYYNVSFVKDNPVDACVAMIEKLNELKLL